MSFLLSNANVIYVKTHAPCHYIILKAPVVSVNRHVTCYSILVLMSPCRFLWCRTHSSGGLGRFQGFGKRGGKGRGGGGGPFISDSEYSGSIPTLTSNTLRWLVQYMVVVPTEIGIPCI